MSSYSVIIIISMLFAVLTNTAPQKLDTTPLITPKDGEPLGTIIGIPWVMVAYWLAAFIIFAFILLTFMYGLPKWGWWKLKGPGPKPEMIRSWVCFLTLHHPLGTPTVSFGQEFTCYPDVHER